MLTILNLIISKISKEFLNSKKVGNTEVVREGAGDGVYAFDTRGPLMKEEKFETVSWQVSS